MASDKEYFAPYTSIGNMLLLFKQIRKGWIPGQIDKGEMVRVGITAGNANRTIAALEYFGLIDENKVPTNTWKAIATATTNDYPTVLEGILRSSYPTIFELHPNPNDATDVEISNAFAKSEPLRQRDRMIALFRGLCQEAGLISGEPLTREKTSSPKRNSDSSSKADQKRVPATPPSVNPSLRWYNDLETLMSKLPNPDSPKWTKSEKERWLAALQATLDLLIDTEG